MLFKRPRYLNFQLCNLSKHFQNLTLLVFFKIKRNQHLTLQLHIYAHIYLVIMSRKTKEKIQMKDRYFEKIMNLFHNTIQLLLFTYLPNRNHEKNRHFCSHWTKFMFQWTFYRNALQLLYLSKPVYNSQVVGNFFTNENKALHCYFEEV